MRLFDTSELRIIKYKLMKKGYTEKEAHKEIKGMIETAKKSKKLYNQSQKKEKQKEVPTSLPKIKSSQKPNKPKIKLLENIIRPMKKGGRP